MKLVADISAASRPWHPATAPADWRAPYAAPSGALPALVLDFVAGVYGTAAGPGGLGLVTRTGDAKVVIDAAAGLSTVPAGTPALTHGGVPASPRGLWLEPARTNLMHFDWSVYGTEGASLGTGGTAPSGETAATLIEDTGVTPHGLSRNLNGLDAALAWSYSVLARPLAGRRWMTVRLNEVGAGGNYVEGWFDLLDGAVGTLRANGAGAIEGAAMEPLAGGWWRIALSGRVGTGAASGVVARVHGAVADGARAYGGSGAAEYEVASDQLEAGDWASSYVATAGAAASRAADAARSALVAAGAVSVLVRGSFEGGDDGAALLAASDGPGTEALTLRREAATGAAVAELRAGGAVAGTVTGPAAALAPGASFALAAAAGGGTLALSSGGPAVTGAAGTLGALSDLHLLSEAAAAAQAGAVLSRIVAWTERLPDADLAALTS